MARKPKKPPPKKKKRTALGGDKNNPHGRYKASYCELIVEVMSEGRSVASFAGHPDVRVAKQTVYNWMAKYPKFDAAHKIGKAASVYFWEGKLIDAAGQDIVKFIKDLTEALHKADATPKDITDLITRLERLQRATGKNVGPIVFALKNLDSELWRDKIEHDHGNKSDEPLRFQVEFVDAKDTATEKV